MQTFSLCLLPCGLLLAPVLPGSFYLPTRSPHTHTPPHTPTRYPSLLRAPHSYPPAHRPLPFPTLAHAVRMVGRITCATPSWFAAGRAWAQPPPTRATPPHPVRPTRAAHRTHAATFPTPTRRCATTLPHNLPPALTVPHRSDCAAGACGSPTCRWRHSLPPPAYTSSYAIAQRYRHLLFTACVTPVQPAPPPPCPYHRPHTVTPRLGLLRCVPTQAHTLRYLCGSPFYPAVCGCSSRAFGSFAPATLRSPSRTRQEELNAYPLRCRCHAQRYATTRLDYPRFGLRLAHALCVPFAVYTRFFGHR